MGSEMCIRDRIKVSAGNYFSLPSDGAIDFEKNHRKVEWSRLNRCQLNTDKCKELRISFAKNKPDLPPLMACGNVLEVVDSAKLLGVTITSNSTWNLHVAEVIKKISKRLYFLLQLKRAHVPKS